MSDHSKRIFIVFSRTSEKSRTHLFKRLAGVFLLVTVSVYFATGCGGQINLDPQPQAKKTIVMAHNQSRRVVYDTIKHSTERFVEDNPEFEVEIELYINEAYKKKLATAAATGNLPDIFATWSGSTLNEFARLDMVVELSDLMNANQDIDRFLPSAIDQVRYEDGIWAVPVENIAVGLIFYNKAIFEKLNLQTPDTWDELLEVITVLKNNGYIPFALANRAGWPASMYYMYLVDRLGGEELFEGAKNRTLDQGFAADEFIRAWEYFKQLVDMGAFPDNANTLDEDVGDSKQLMYDGKAAMMLTGSWLISDVYDEHYEYLDKIDFFTFPIISEGKGHPQNIIGTVGDQFYSISSNSQWKEESYDLIRYFIDETAVEERLEAYLIPPLMNIKPSDPMLNKIVQLAVDAPSVQLWYDQSISPKLAEEHKQICREVLEILDPLAAAERMEQAAKQYE